MFSYLLRMHIMLSVGSCLIGFGCLAFGWVSAAAAPRPNVVLVVIDDMGYGDLSCQGSPFIQTSQLDALHASERNALGSRSDPQFLTAHWRRILPELRKQVRQTNRAFRQ